MVAERSTHLFEVEVIILSVYCQVSLLLHSPFFVPVLASTSHMYVFPFCFRFPAFTATLQYHSAGAYWSVLPLAWHFTVLRLWRAATPLIASCKDLWPKQSETRMLLKDGVRPLVHFGKQGNGIQELKIRGASRLWWQKCRRMVAAGLAGTGTNAPLCRRQNLPMLSCHLFPALTLLDLCIIVNILVRLW